MRATGPKRRSGARPESGGTLRKYARITEIRVGQPVEHLRWHPNDTRSVRADSPPDDAHEIGMGITADGGGQAGGNQTREEKIIDEHPPSIPVP